MHSKIKVFIMDIDGTMTDGKIYMGNDGELFKSFDIKDGYGVHEILPSYNVKTVILTGRKSKIVDNRAKELEINLVLQNVKDKKSKMFDIAKEFECQLSEIAYIGDDMADKKAMEMCGIKGCPSDAIPQIIEICDFVTKRAAGNGAVREFIEWLILEQLI